jgi:hypothetical protein
MRWFRRIGPDCSLPQRWIIASRIVELSVNPDGIFKGCNQRIHDI